MSSTLGAATTILTIVFVDRGFMVLDLPYISLVFSGISLIISLLSYGKARLTEKENKLVKSNQLVNEAWDLLGGQAGSFQVKVHPGQQNMVLAKRKIDEALLVYPKSQKALSVLGTYYMLSKEYYSAMGIYLKIIESDSTTESVHYNLADIYSKLGNFHEAESAYVKSIELSPLRSSPHHNLAHLYIEMKKDKLAIEEFEIAISLSPDELDSYHDLALLHYQNGSYESSIDVLFRALKYIKNNTERSKIYGLLGLQYKMLGREKDATYAFEAAVELDKTNETAIENAARFFFEAGELSLALEYFTMAKKVEPNNLQNSYNRAIVLCSQGKKNEASKELSEILKRDPYYPDAKERLNSLNGTVA